MRRDLLPCGVQISHSFEPLRGPNRNRRPLPMIGGNSKSFNVKVLASMLVKLGIDYADDRGLPADLEASPAGLGVYQKHGFKVVDRRRQKCKVVQIRWRRVLAQMVCGRMQITKRICG